MNAFCNQPSVSGIGPVGDIRANDAPAPRATRWKLPLESVFVGVGVAVWAFLNGSIPIGHPVVGSVFEWASESEMDRVDASASSTNVINLHSFRDGFDEQFKGNSVRLNRESLFVYSHGESSITNGSGTGPEPAPVSVELEFVGKPFHDGFFPTVNEDLDVIFRHIFPRRTTTRPQEVVLVAEVATHPESELKVLCSGVRPTKAAHTLHPTVIQST